MMGLQWWFVSNILFIWFVLFRPFCIWRGWDFWGITGKAIGTLMVATFVLFTLNFLYLLLWMGGVFTVANATFPEPDEHGEYHTDPGKNYIDGAVPKLIRNQFNDAKCMLHSYDSSPSGDIMYACKAQCRRMDLPLCKYVRAAYTKRLAVKCDLVHSTMAMLDKLGIAVTSENLQSKSKELKEGCRSNIPYEVNRKPGLYEDYFSFTVYLYDFNHYLYTNVIKKFTNDKSAH